MTGNLVRSTFVTVVAWIFIALSGFSTVISLVQNVLIQTLFRSAQMQQALHAPPPGSPPAAVFLMSHMELFLLAFLLVSAFTLVSSIGLLKRWNWARLCFIGLMLLGIVWQLAGVGWQFAMFSSMQQLFSATAGGAPDMRPFLLAATILGALFALGFSVLFGWIAKRLMSAPVAAEFRR